MMSCGWQRASCLAGAGGQAVFIRGRSEPEGAIAIARRAVSHEQVFVVLGRRCQSRIRITRRRGAPWLDEPTSTQHCPKCNVGEVGCLETFRADLDRMRSVAKAEKVRKGSQGVAARGAVRRWPGMERVWRPHGLGRCQRPLHHKRAAAPRPGHQIIQNCDER